MEGREVKKDHKKRKSPAGNEGAWGLYKHPVSLDQESLRIFLKKR
jgi:hypothetical protein